MKNLFVVLAVVLTTGQTPVFAHGKNSDPLIEAAFAKKFTGADNVTWTKLDADYQKASFTLGGSRAEAYFNNEGELLGTARNLLFNQLPLIVIQTIGNKFTDAPVIEITEITNSDGTSYKVVLEHRNKKYSLRLNSLGDITDQQKAKIN